MQGFQSKIAGVESGQKWGPIADRMSDGKVLMLMNARPFKC